MVACSGQGCYDDDDDMQELEKVIREQRFLALED
jgi:hypothetical protein